MKTTETKSATPASRVAKTRGGRKSPLPGPSAARISDTASGMGIPETELTDRVRHAIGFLAEEVDALRRELATVKQRLSETERLADSDGLTPLLNRRAFVRELSRMVSFSQRYHVPATLLYFDLNGFKEVNDTLGHAAGDAALLHVAELLLGQVRGSDVVGRLGGDEFGVILAQADQAAAQAKAEALVRAIAQTPLEWEGKPVALTASFGLYVFRPGSDPNQVLQEADRSMYRSKAGRAPPDE